MNNTQFRKLVLDTPARQNHGDLPSQSAVTPSALGAKKSSFMPMTPRTVQGGADVDFARQVRERNAALRPTKKFKSSTAPKGAKYAKGYTDRARAREEAGDGEDNKAARIKALEEQMKLGQISVEMFESLRDQITGGEASSTHLVKGLDRKLLERVKRGEDVLGFAGGDTAVESAPDVDEELDKLGEQEITEVKREKAEKRGMMGPPPPVAGKKRSRDEIMAELKAQREAAARANAAPSLDARWRKVGAKERSRIEVDHKGREVLITVDEDGFVKRKMRPANVKRQEGGATESAGRAVVDMPDESKPVLGAGAEVPQRAPPPTPIEDGDDDIFEGVGAGYNPLGIDLDDEGDTDQEEPDEHDSAPPRLPSEPSTEIARPDEDDASETSSRTSSATEEAAAPNQQTASSGPGVHIEVAADSLDSNDRPQARPRSYFKDTAKPGAGAEVDHFAGIQNVLKKAAKLDRAPEDTDARDGETEEAHQARVKRRAQMLAQQDRDLEDMDIGFGSSRVEDEAEDDGEGKKIKLSEWKQGPGVDDDDGDEGKGGREKKKRKPKKRKGDVNSAADIMRVIEGRKTAK
ncbi:hypothetical protein LTR57_007226 [Friedmanniomyces endolithicus]|uniref:RED-like N-terminal domain-containing protein n=1 Tax=Friedmanniomyces endolithicus TaxID=329885 RepID=A0AAN6J980_9PEZI|nr:hypothetical protein LTS09_011760 [Friedmanniomyces endolithicus]KAK0268818.1 hypothetical protein LTR35_015240 [Friedmanniomyces endolithicus]KAK0299991.1 hypothetical protein LTS00_001761 [Friedmanniomyces endolithicus]KAK0321172.1 hypothetical protein LTR82_007624 [Friedmanniomyces endolithicus]KAK0922929.1 hypothetical protein LTR57_007226 [Friedmanniomyces endolithicus]